MKPLNNFKGYCLATFVADGSDDEISRVIGRPRGEWKVNFEPLTIYPTVEGLIESIGETYNKKVHTICEVILHITGERVEVISYGLPKANRPE